MISYSNLRHSQKIAVEAYCPRCGQPIKAHSLPPVAKPGVMLTLAETLIWDALARNPGQVVPIERLVSFTTTPGSVRSIIFHIRQKTNARIVALWGRGYVLDVAHEFEDGKTHFNKGKPGDAGRIETSAETPEGS